MEGQQEVPQVPALTLEQCLALRQKMNEGYQPSDEEMAAAIAFLRGDQISASSKKSPSKKKAKVSALSQADIAAMF